MDLVISHPVIKDKGIRNIYSGLHSHHLVGPRSCETGERVIKEDIKHIHAKEKFRRSQLEYIPKFQTCLPKAPAYTTVDNRKIKRIVERLYSGAQRPQSSNVSETGSQDRTFTRSVRFSNAKPPSAKEQKPRAQSAQSAHPRAFIIFPNMRSRRNCRSAKSSVSDDKTLRSDSPTSCRSELTLDLSKLNTKKKRKPKTSVKSEGYPSVLSNISNCYSEKDQTYYKPSRQSLFEMIQDLYLDEEAD